MDFMNLKKKALWVFPLSSKFVQLQNKENIIFVIYICPKVDATLFIKMYNFLQAKPVRRSLLSL